MATDQRTLAAFFNVDADFQGWCQGIAAQLVAAGMVKAADTGQINNATVAKPASSNTAQGYEIYKFSDTLQATYPIYIKIEYGSGPTAQDRPGLWITVGQGSNGAGTLTGATTTRTQIAASSSKALGVTLPSFCSGDGSRLALMTNYDSGASAFSLWVAIDRLRDGSNNTTSDGVTVHLGSATAGMVQTIIGSTAQTNMSIASVVTWAGTFVNSTRSHGGGVSSTGGNAAVIPPIVLAGQVRFLAAWVFYNTADIVGGTQVTATVLGATHNYLALSSLASLVAGCTSTSDKIAMLWE